MPGGDGFWQPLDGGGGDGAGRWEVVVAGSPLEAVTDDAETDWLYAWTED